MFKIRKVGKDACAYVLGHVQLFFDPMDCSPPGSSVYGICQARLLEWIVIPFGQEVCDFLNSVSLQQKFEVTDRPVLQLSFICKQRKICPWGVRVGQPKRQEEKRSPKLNFGSSFYMFFFLLPLSLPYVNSASQEGCLFYLRSSLQSWTFLCSIFTGFSLFVF